MAVKRRPQSSRSINVPVASFRKPDDGTSFQRRQRENIRSPYAGPVTDWVSPRNGKHAKRFSFPNGLSKFLCPSAQGNCDLVRHQTR